MTTTVEGRGPTRRKGRRSSAGADGDSRARILAAAEGVFAESGYDGGSLRQVAAAAGVPLSLVTYHFGEKLGLYREVFRSRVPEIVQQRMAGLALADLERDPARRLELVVKAFLVPMLQLRATERGRAFARVLAREAVDPSGQRRGIVGELLAPVSEAFVARLTQAVPEGDRASALWAYAGMVGAMLYVMGGAGRMREVSDGLVDPDDVRTCTERLVAIAIAGLRR